MTVPRVLGLNVVVVVIFGEIVVASGTPSSVILISAQPKTIWAWIILYSCLFSSIFNIVFTEKMFLGTTSDGFSAISAITPVVASNVTPLQHALAAR